MARYRHKDETDLVWNAIRREITVEIDKVIRNERERILNDALTKAWDEFATAIGEGKVPEVESKYSRFAASIVKDALPKIEERASVRTPVD